jgi:predicted MFS family arabinose efflux permease
VSFFLIGGGPMLWVISTTTLRQAVTTAAQLGRVSAVITTATYGARPLGAALGAVVGGWLGVEACLVAVALGFPVQALIILASPVAGLVSQPEATAADQPLRAVTRAGLAGLTRPFRAATVWGMRSSRTASSEMAAPARPELRSRWTIMLQAIGMGLGAYGGGWIHDHLGTYAWLFGSATAAAAVAILFALPLQSSRRLVAPEPAAA